MSTKPRFSSILMIIPAFLFLSFLCSAVVLAADQPKPETTFKSGRPPTFMIPEARHTDIPIPTSISFSVFGPERGVTTNSPGNLIGTTTFDLQHNGAMARQVSFSNANNRVHMVWTCQSSSIMPGDRGICYTAYDPGIGYSGSTKATEADYAGYAAGDVLPGGAAMFVCHVLEQPSNEYHSRYYYENSIPPSDFLYDQFTGGMETIWPVTEVHCSDSPGVTEDVVYMLTHDFMDSEDMILYRKIGAGAWDGGIYIETCTNLSYTIAADPNSDNIAIVYTDDRAGLAEGGGGQTDMDVYCRRSTDQGYTWNEPQNISNYTLDSLWRAYAEVSALFTSDGVLHAIWNARKLQSPDHYENYKCRLVHWSSDLQQTSFIDDADYDISFDEEACDPGAWAMYIAKMSISQCDNKLYALYTKYGDALDPGALSDCSNDNYANGELFLSASDDGGFSWSPPQNLTQTRTPGCNGGDCESDNWASMVRYGMIYGDETVLDTLDIVYINDKDAGSIPQGEGTWCINNVMHYRFPCNDVEHVARVYLDRDSIDTHTLHGEEQVVTLEIANIGNASLNIESIVPQYLDGDGWIGIGPYSSLMAIGNYQTIAITLNVGGMLNQPITFWNADILIDTDSPSDVISVPVSLLITDEPHGFTCDTLETTSKRLIYCNTGRLGFDEDGYSLDIPGDCDADLENLNAEMYLYGASPIIAWNNGVQNLVYTCMYTQWPAEDGTFKPISPITMTSGPDYNLAVCTIATTDDRFGINVELWGPTDGNDFVIARYEYYPLGDPSGLDQIHLGMILDWDVPADYGVDNSSGWNFSPTFVWQRGVETDPADEGPPNDCPIEEDQRYAGVTTLFETFAHAWTLPNAPWQEGSGYNPDLLYNKMVQTGIGIYTETGEDSVIDLHTGFRSKTVDMSGGDMFSSIFVLSTSNDGISTIEDDMSAAYDWAVAHDITPVECLCWPGDVNGDWGPVGVGDAVYIVSYVFKGGPGPTPYDPCSGDANGDCQCNIGDAVFIINRVFKGGGPPPTCEEWVGDCGSHY